MFCGSIESITVGLGALLVSSDKFSSILKGVQDAELYMLRS